MAKKENDIINVMHCFTYVYDGGQETFITKTFKYIEQNSARRFRFMIVALVDADNPPLEEKYKEQGIELFRLNFINRKRKFGDYFHNLKQLMALSKLIRAQKVNILYGHDFFSALIVRLAYLLCLLRFYKVNKVYISLHNLLYWLKRPHHMINRFLSFFTDKIVCVSNSVLEFSLKNDKIKRSKYQVIYNGIDVNEFYYDKEFRNIMRRQYNIDDNKYVVGAIGTISFRKGHHILIKAFSKFYQKNKNSELVIFGGFRDVDGDDKVQKIVKDLIAEYGLQDVIRILKPRLDIYKAYSMFDVYVMPSVVEGFGLSLVEAMSCESLIIASDIEPFREILTDTHNAFLFKSGDDLDLLEKLDMANRLPADCAEKMKKNARDEVIANIDSAKMGKNFARLYEDI